MLIVLLISLFNKNTDVFSPVRLFVIVWSLAIGLADLKLSRYQLPWSIFSWIMLLLPLLATLTGMYVVYVLNFDESINNLYTIRRSLQVTPINSELLFRIIIILFLAYLFSYLITTIVVGYITFFAPKPDRARMDWGIFGFGLLVQSIPAILFLIIQYLSASISTLTKRVLITLIFILAFTSYFFLLERYYLVFSLFIITVFLYYRTNMLRFRNVIIVFSGLGTLFYFISSIRLSRYAINFVYYLSDMKFGVKYAIFSEPYMYVVMNLENFAYAVTKVENYTFGLLTFDPIFALTGLKHTLIEYLYIPKYPAIVNSNFNTFTMYFIYYWDFGVLGLSVIPFIFGMFFSFTYYNMRKNPDMKSVSIYSIIVFIISFSFFVPVISFLHFIFNLIIIFFVTKKVLIRKGTPANI